MSAAASQVTTVTPAVIQQPTQGSRIVKQISTQQVNLTIPPNDDYALFNEDEIGDLVGFEITTDSKDVILQIITYADNLTVPYYINNFTMETLLQMGRGLTPGEVEILPNGRSQDIKGTPSPVYPYLARYKTDQLVDLTGQIEPAIVLRYEPTIYRSFKKIIANLINSSLDVPATIISMDIQRLVYVELAAGETSPDATQLGTSSFRRTVTVPSPGVPSYVRKKKQSQNEPLIYDPQESL